MPWLAFDGVGLAVLLEERDRGGGVSFFAFWGRLALGLLGRMYEVEVFHPQPSFSTSWEISPLPPPCITPRPIHPFLQRAQ